MLRRVLRGLVTAGAVLDSGSRVRVAPGRPERGDQQPATRAGQNIKFKQVPYSKGYRELCVTQ